MDNMFELIAQPASGEEKKPEARLSIMVRLSSFGRICFVAGPCLVRIKRNLDHLSAATGKSCFPTSSRNHLRSSGRISQAIL
jgi:hypothetical protein